MLPFLTLTGPVSVLLLGLARCWLLAGAAGAVTAAAIATQIPLYVADNAADTGIRLERSPRCSTQQGGCSRRSGP
jgi:hypothetical protein